MADSGELNYEIDQEAFEKAADHLTTLANSLDDDKLLYLYARYKQAKEGPCDIPRPGFFSLQAKRKWTAWQNLGSMSTAQAMKEYVDEISALDPTWNPGRDSVESKPKLSGLGVSVSRLKLDPDEVVCDDMKNLFDWIKDGNPSHVSRYLENGGDSNLVDSEGMALLHWASDRGHSEIVMLLLRRDANVNIQDSDGQTPLHYASSCGHTETIKVLLDGGADIFIADNENMTPKDVAMDCDVAMLIAR